MEKGEFPDGARTLRAKIDMASPNINMRDPVMYRIKHASHHRSGDRGASTRRTTTRTARAIRSRASRTRSARWSSRTTGRCTIGSAKSCGIHHPQQIEFARLNLTYTVMSKRKLLQLVQEKHVAGWDDPRMLTIRGLRRRGYTPEAIRAFCERIGVAKFNSTIDMAWLEDAIRDDLNERAPRVMAVLRPLKVVITTIRRARSKQLEAANHPQKPEMGTRTVPFSRELYIEADDFMEDAPKKFFRLAPGREVRLRYAYFITCTEVVKDKAGNVTELRCTYDPATRGGNAPDGRKVKGTIHWVSAPHAHSAAECGSTITSSRPRIRTMCRRARRSSTTSIRTRSKSSATRSSNRRSPTPGRGSTSNSSGSATSSPTRIDSKPGRPVFNRTVTLRDTGWAKEAAKG